jgi:hypothetical protein
MQKTTPGSLPLAAAPTPEWFLSWAIRVIPAQTKFVLSGVIVFAGTALVLGWTSRLSISLTFSIAVLILVFGLVASAISAAPKALTGVGGFLAWALAILFVALLVLLLTSAFFGTPPAGARLLARVLGSSEILTQIRSSARPIIIETGQIEAFSSLPRELRTEPSRTDIPARIQELATLPELIIRGTLQMTSPGEKRVLSASTLRFDGGTLLTNGGDLVIEVNNLVADNGSIRAFDNPEVAQPNASGRSAGRVTLIVHGTISGGLSVDLRGGRGGDGASGVDGGKGPKGQRGANAASGLFDCQRGAGSGGRGGQGQAGSDGKPGFAGGKGGLLIVRAADVEAAKRVIGTPLVAGGKGGNGGVPGRGGEGGDGGDGGSPVGLCSGGGPTGPQGERGSSGQPGRPGQEGDPGSFTFTSLASV